VKPLEDLPTSFWCLMTRGGYQLKLKGLAHVFLNSILSGFANGTVLFCPVEYLSILFSGLGNNVLCENYVLSPIICI
jgi:hypothetical protein